MIAKDWPGASTSDVWERVRAAFPAAAFEVRLQGDQLLVEVLDGDEAAIAAFLGTLTPTTEQEWSTRLPPNLVTHVDHLRQFFTAQRDGTQAAKTSAVRLSDLEHVAADLILTLRELVRKDL